MTRITKLSRSIEGEVALITGAASGMGRATAELFADEGAKVAVTDVDEAGVEEVVARITAAGGVAHGWKLDVGDADDIRRVVDEIAGRWSAVDILVNNAGISAGAPIDSEQHEEVWARAFEILLTGQMRLVKACLPHLRRSQAPRIVNIASTEGLGATPRSSPYTSAKTGVIGLTRSLAVELGREGITVNCICPGPIHTGMTAAISDEHKQIFARRRTALARYGDPEEVAHATLSFVLPAASYITGAVLPVDGGLMARNA
ncbi:MAG: SDR family NAD(P)-dependent oxidoreductase [Pseudomonadales bacterium]